MPIGLYSSLNSYSSLKLSFLLWTLHVCKTWGFVLVQVYLTPVMLFTGTYKWQNPEGPLMPCSWIQHLWILILIQIENHIGWIPGCIILICFYWLLQRSADFHQLRICGDLRVPICSATSTGCSHQQSLPTVFEFWPIHQCPQGDKSDRG